MSLSTHRGLALEATPPALAPSLSRPLLVAVMIAAAAVIIRHHPPPSAAIRRARRTA